MPVLVPCACAPDGSTVLAHNAIKSAQYTCFGCGNRLVVHKGAVRVHHFKHHALGCGGESSTHKVAKAFVAAAVLSPTFTICTRCPDCDASTVAIRGGPDFFAQQECQASVLGRSYRVDVSVGRGVVAWADIEICHTSPCPPLKVRDLALSSRHGLLEVKATDVLGGSNCLYAMQPRRCHVCAKQKLAHAAHRRAVATVRRCLAKRRARRATARLFLSRWRAAAKNSFLLREDQHSRAHLSSAPADNGVRVVNAPAGGGKTTLILEMARHCSSALLLTFSKDLSRSIAAAPNVTVMTFDSACYSKTSIGGSLTDRAVVQQAWRACQPWYKKKGGRGIADVVAARLQCAEVELCDNHSGKSMNYGIRVGMGLDSFARSRYLVETKQIDLAAGYEHVFIDEYQDLTPQALRIILASATPKTLVGDPNQSIFKFQNELCSGCGCAVKHPPPPLSLPPPLRVTRTFRSPLSIVRHLAQHGITTACRNRRGGFLGMPEQSLRHLGETNVCVLVRSNSRLYEIARLLHRWHGRVNVIGGKDTGDSVAKLSKLTTGRPISPLHGWVRKLADPLGVAEFLRAQGNGSLNGTAAAMVSTVHRAKGSEHKHVVLADDFDRTKEFEVWYVAHTRHRATLVQLAGQE